MAMQYLEVTKVAELSTGTIGLTLRGDEATDYVSALQIDSKYKQTRCSCNNMHYTWPIKYPPSNLYLHNNSQGLPRKNKLGLLLWIILSIQTSQPNCSSTHCQSVPHY